MARSSCSSSSFSLLCSDPGVYLFQPTCSTIEGHLGPSVLWRLRARGLAHLCWVLSSSACTPPLLKLPRSSPSGSSLRPMTQPTADPLRPAFNLPPAFWDTSRSLPLSQCPFSVLGRFCSFPTLDRCWSTSGCRPCCCTVPVHTGSPGQPSHPGLWLCHLLHGDTLMVTSPDNSCLPVIQLQHLDI